MSSLQWGLLAFGLLVIAVLWLVLFAWSDEKTPKKSRRTPPAPQARTKVKKPHAPSHEPLHLGTMPPRSTGSAHPLPEEQWPFIAVHPIITPPEQILYRRLIESLPECMVLAQVQLSRVLDVKEGHPFYYWHNRINRMSLDFVICRWNGRLVAVIELDDRSHERADRMAADAKKNAALAAAGVPIVRWKVHAMPNHKEIRKAMRECGMEI